MSAGHGAPEFLLPEIPPSRLPNRPRTAPGHVGDDNEEIFYMHPQNQVQRLPGPVEPVTEPRRVRYPDEQGQNATWSGICSPFSPVTMRGQPLPERAQGVPSEPLPGRIPSPAPSGSTPAPGLLGPKSNRTYLPKVQDAWLVGPLRHHHGSPSWWHFGLCYDKGGELRCCVWLFVLLVIGGIIAGVLMATRPWE